MNKRNKIQASISIISLLIVFILGFIINSSYQFKTLEYSNLNINQDELNIFYLNVGQGDSTFITINGYNMLIDSGNDSDGYYISQFLKSQNITKIDSFIITHFDEDHMGGAYKLLEEISVGTLYTPSGNAETQTYKKFKNTIKEKNINVNSNLIVSNQIAYPIGNANWKVLNINGETPNDSSIVIELNYNTTKYLFMGDASEKIENQLECTDIDVLKVSHHGSKTATSQEFLNKITLKYAIISVGENNSYGLPSQEVLNRLLNNNVETYRTDKNGTIWITSDGNLINIKTLEYNLDGSGRKQASIFQRKYYLLSFYNFTT